MSTPSAQFDIKQIRSDFPIFTQQMNGHPLVYLDSAATAQKPKHVIDRLHRFYADEYATIHRGVYTISQDSTHHYDEVRHLIQRFLNAKHAEEIIFTKGTTESINLVAATFGQTHINKGDTIILSQIEHHANIVPWVRVAENRGCQIKVIPCNDAGELDIAWLNDNVDTSTKLVAVGHVSNALGTINPIAEIIKVSHQHGAKVLIDGAQAVQHIPVDVQALDCDFYTFSSHKLYGPTGVGILFAKKDILDRLPPYQSGGDMIEKVTFEKVTYAHTPQKFEAGTPAIAEGLGLGAAIEYVQSVGLDKIADYESQLLKYATDKLRQINGLTIIGTAKEKASVISFVLEGVHPHDIGQFLDQKGICIRVGHHCAQPTMKRFGIPATARLSLAFYNTPEEIDLAVNAIQGAKDYFA